MGNEIQNVERLAQILKREFFFLRKSEKSATTTTKFTWLPQVRWKLSFGSCRWPDARHDGQSVQFWRVVRSFWLQHDEWRVRPPEFQNICRQAVTPVTRRWKLLLENLSSVRVRLLFPLFFGHICPKLVLPGSVNQWGTAQGVLVWAEGFLLRLDTIRSFRSRLVKCTTGSEILGFN